MKRQIKFRGKIKDKNSLLFNQWIYGYFFKFSSRYVISDNFDIGYEWTKDFCNVDENTVGQFTGLKDKNGVEIYEGDVIESIGYVKPYLQDIKYNEKLGGYYINFCYTEDIKYVNLGEKIKWIEVVGNIYDNPELLESEEIK